MEGCPEIAGAQEVPRDAHEVRIRFQSAEISAQEMITRAAAALPVADLTIEAPDIDLLVADMYRRMQL